MKSAAPLVGTPKAFWLARNFVWWSRWEGEGKDLVGTCFVVVRVRVRIRVKVRVMIWISSLPLSPSPYPEFAVGTLQGAYTLFLNIPKFCENVGTLQGA